MQVLRDPLWQFVGVVLAAVAVSLSAVLAILQRQRKRLQYDEIAKTPLLTLREELQGRIKVLLDEQPIKDVAIVVFRIANIGNVPIRATDYERPISVTFGEGSQVLSAEIVEQLPSNIGANIATLDSKSVTFLPVLLNSADHVVVKCLVVGLEQTHVDARIAGVHHVTQPSGWVSPGVVLLLSLSLITCVVGLVYMFAVTPSGRPPTREQIVALLIGACGVVLFLAALAKWVRYIWRRLSYVDRRTGQDVAS